VARKREQASREILEAAKSILRRSGADAITLASVSSELGMTKQALYHYYPSKESLMQALVTLFISDEVETLISRIEQNKTNEDLLGAMIRQFYLYYSNHLEQFRVVYGQSQLYSGNQLGLDQQVIQQEINPRTKELFDILEDRLSNGSEDIQLRKKMRLLAFTAWSSALGLMTILSVTDALNDPLIHSNKDLLDTLNSVFNQAIKSQ